MSSSSAPSWEAYAAEVKEKYDPLDIDIERKRQRFEEHLTDLVEKNGHRIEVQALTVNDSPPTPGQDAPRWSSYGSIQAVRQFLAKKSQGPQAAFAHLFITIAPTFSWGRLQICRGALFTLLTHYAVFPAFFDLLRTFGNKTWEAEENFGIYRQHLQDDGNAATSCFQICYNLRYPELVNKGDPKSLEWTTRKTAVFAKFYSTTKQTVSIILQPSNSFMRRLSGLANTLSHMDTHRLQLSCAAEDMEDYISHLERKFYDLFMEASFVKKGPEPSLEHAQSLQLQRDQLTRLKHTLKSNHHVIKSMKQGFERLQHADSGPLFWDEAAFKKFDESLEDHLKAIEHHVERVDSIERRCNSLSGLVPTLLASQENSLMRSMQQTANQHSRSMRTLTIVALLYLPAMFVATMFSVGFLTGPMEDPKTAAIAFVCLVFGLTAMTIGGWLWYERYSTRTVPKKGDEEAQLEDKGGNGPDAAVARGNEEINHASTLWAPPEAAVGTTGMLTAGESCGTMAESSERATAGGATAEQGAEGAEAGEALGE